MNKQQFLAMSAITDLKGFVDGRSTNAGRTMYTLHSVPNKCKTVQLAASMYEDEFYVDIDRFKPILHPLSDITKEIEHNGEKFVPVEEIEKIIGHGWCEAYDDAIDVLIEFNERVLMMPYEIIEILISWHFNTMDESEPFIDVNTLDVNPYK